MERRQSSTETGTTTSSFARPRSTWTEDSDFADSAVDINATTTLPRKDSTTERHADCQTQSLSPISHSLTDRLRRLAARAWALEQEDDISDSKRQQIENNLKVLEAIVRDGDVAADQSTRTQSLPDGVGFDAIPTRQGPVMFKEESWIGESDLLEIHDELVSVVASMRLRQQEQRHLHQLTATKLEAVAQKCIFQEQQMQDLLRDMQSIRLENQALGQENDRLQDSIAEMESEASRREVAVSAMTSAVAGLEGWIDDADRARQDYRVDGTPAHTHRQRRAVIRGKGRFRGRYYVDEGYHRFSLGSPDARDLQDGVRAWIRGFKDVEDACTSPISGRAKELYGGRATVDEDDWGEFESPGAQFQ